MQVIMYYWIKWIDDNCQYMRMWNEAIVTCLKVPSWNLLWETEIITKNLS